MKTDPAVLFWRHIDLPTSAHACWEWNGHRNAHGYGRLTVHRRTWLAPRWLMTQLLGRDLQWDDELKEVVCHHCDNPPCVNPSHLYVGTASSNMQDAVGRGRHAWAAKTHCPQGHEYTPENTYDANGKRNCKACSLVRAQRSRERRRAA